MRLDAALYKRKLTQSRSQAENYIKLGLVKVNGAVAKKASFNVNENDTLVVVGDQYVSRAALKLASIAKQFALDFRDKTVLDVGSSTGGFTDYALQHGAIKVIAVDVGTEQLHPKLRADNRVELYEKTDIRDIWAKNRDSGGRTGQTAVFIGQVPQIIVADVSFISLRKILPHLSLLSSHSSILIMMCKPQFEAGKEQVHKGIIKNSKIRRDILAGFEQWLGDNGYIVLDKADSQVAGTKGNVERFYKLKLAK